MKNRVFIIFTLILTAAIGIISMLGAPSTSAASTKPTPSNSKPPSQLPGALISSAPGQEVPYAESEQTVPSPGSGPHQAYTLQLRGDCPSEPLAFALHDLQHSGQVGLDARKTNNTLLITAAPVPEKLHRLPCVQGVESGWHLPSSPPLDSARQPSVVLTGTGHITGTVTAAEGGLPLANIAVTAYTFDGASWAAVNSDTTSGGGLYDIGALPPAAYRLRFADLSANTYQTEYYDDAPTIALAHDIFLSATQTITATDAALAVGGHVTGTVTAAAIALPLAGVSACAHIDYGLYWVELACATTASDGAYDIGRLPTANIRVNFSPNSDLYFAEYYDDALDIDSAADVPVTATLTTPAINAALSEAGLITGTVTTANGAVPLAGIEIQLYRHVGSWWEEVGTVSSSPQGQFTFGQLETDLYRLRFSDPNANYIAEYFDDVFDFADAVDIWVTSGTATTNINADLALGAHISGTVTAAGGAPLGDIDVEVYTYNAAGASWETIGYDLTASDGTYDIGGLPAGTYRLRFVDSSAAIYIAEYFDNASDLEAATDIILPAGGTASGTNAILALGGSISGAITAEPSSLPLVAIRACAYVDQGSYWEGIGRCGLTGAAGNYAITALPSNTYRVQFIAINEDYVTEFYDDAAALDQATSIPVTAGAATTGINAVLAPAGHITGTVTAGQDGLPLPDITITIHQYNNLDSHWESAAWGYTDGLGAYDIGGLREGIYRVGFADWPNNRYAPEYFDDVLDITAAGDVSVTAGAATPNISAALAESGSITGTVVSAPDDALLPGIDVEVFRFSPVTDSWKAIAYGQTDASGAYEIIGLPPGQLRVGFFDRLNHRYAAEYYDDALFVSGANDVTVTAAAVTPNIDANLSAAGQISGMVTAEFDASPIEHVEVSAYRSAGPDDWRWVASAFTSAAGAYQIAELRPGPYRVRFYDPHNFTYLEEFYDNAADLFTAADITVVSNQTTIGIDAALARQAHITGTVTAAGSGTPLSGIDVETYRLDDGRWHYLHTHSTIASGQYDVGELTAGAYRLSFVDRSTQTFATKYYNDAASLAGASDILLSTGQIASDLDAALAAAGHITGTINSETSGAPLPGIDVYAYHQDDIPLEHIASSATTGSDGRYDLGMLGTGAYKLWFWDWNFDYVDEKYDDAASFDTAAPVTVTTGLTTANINASLTTAAHITGTITSTDWGTPLADVAVRQYRFDGTDWNIYRSFYSDAHGRYDVGGLPAGTYRLGFLDQNYGHLPEFYDDAATVADAAVITVTPGEIRTNIDAALSLPPAPDHDDIDTSRSISSTPYEDSVDVRGATTADDDPPLPCGPGDQGYGSVWYIVIPAGDTYLNINTYGSSYDTVLALWSGSRGALAALRCNDNKDGLQSRLKNVPLQAGATYYIEVAGHSAPIDQLVLQAEMGIDSQTVPLAAGWNTISSYIDPFDPALETLLAGVQSSMVLLKNDAGQVYWPAAGINDIGSWDLQDGYQIYLTSPATLAISGLPANPIQSPLTLAATQWHIVPYLRETPLPVEQAFATINSQLALAKDGYGQVYWPDFSVNQIGDLKPGSGYHLYLNADGTLTFPAN